MWSGSKKLMNSRTFSIGFVLMAGLIVNIVQDRGTSLSSIERAATAQVKLETIREVATTLSSKEMEGRGTGQAGGERAAQYLAEKFAWAGLKPAGGDSSYQQQIK